jgi:hypothetical protein
MSIVATKQVHEDAYKDFCKWLDKYGHLPPRELLALVSNLLGKMIALQDQRTMSPAEAMEIVASNIQLGNQQIIDELQASKGSA